MRASQRPLVAGLVGLETIIFQGKDPRTALGGAALYAAIAGSAVGPLSLVTAVGSDVSAELKGVCTRTRIDAKFIEVLGPKSFAITGKYDSPEGRLEVSRVRWGAVLLRRPSETSAALAKATGLLLANDDPRVHLELVRRGKPRFLGLCLNAEWLEQCEPAFIELIRLADVVFLNKHEWILLDKTERRLVQARLSFITDGPHAIRYFVNDSRPSSFRQALEGTREAVDPTGCGDAFAGSLFMRLLRRRRWSQESIRTDLAYAIGVAQCKLSQSGALAFAKALRSDGRWFCTCGDSSES